MWWITTSSERNRPSVYGQRKVERENHCSGSDSDGADAEITELLAQSEPLARGLQHTLGVVGDAVLKLVGQAVGQGDAHHPDVYAVLINALDPNVLEANHAVVIVG